MLDAPPRVVATQSGLQLIEKLQKEHGDILFHQSGGWVIPPEIRGV